MSDFDTEAPLLPAPILRTPEPPVHNILVGPLGLRAGWGIVLFLVLAVALGFAGLIGMRAASPHLRHDFKAYRAQHKAAKAHASQPHVEVLPPILVFAQDGTGTAAALCAALILAYVERRRWASYGLPARFLRDLLPGALVGLLAMGLLVGALRAFHLLAFDHRLLFGAAVLRYGLTWLLAFILVGMYEEFLFRGYVQFTLMRGLLGLARRFSPTHPQAVAFWLSALFWSALFFVAHIGNGGENPAGLAAVFLAGVLFSFALWRTGSLWWGIGFHTTWDWSQNFLYGVPDSGTLSVGRLFQTHTLGKPLLSGGQDGPEGSVLVIPILLLVFLVLWFHPQRPQPSVEQEPLPHELPHSLPAPLA